MSDDKNIESVQQSNVTIVERPQIKADRGWYNSIFTQLVAPLVATRYIWLAIEEINPFNMLRKYVPRLAKDENGERVVKEEHGNKYHVTVNGRNATIDGKTWKEPSFGRYVSRNFAAVGMGTTVLGIVGSYSKNTLDDIKSIYAEAVGYELGKKTADVTLADIFTRSNNEAVKITRDAYISRTAGRFATVSAFFLPWHKFRDKALRHIQPKYSVNAEAGVGAVGVNLYAEGLLRKPSFFDLEQKIVGSKINHNDLDPYSAIQPEDIQSLIHLHRKHLNKNYKAPLIESKEGQNDIKLATRIAKLFGDTYDNVPPANTDSFTLGKLNYLIGFGLLDNFPESLAFVELANKSVDMKAVKQVAAAIKNGENSQDAFAKFGIDVQKLAARNEQHAYTSSAPEKKFTDNIQPKTLIDFSAKSPETSLKM